MLEEALGALILQKPWTLVKGPSFGTDSTKLSVALSWTAMKQCSAPWIPFGVGLEKCLIWCFL